MPPEHSETHFLKWLIRYDLSSIEEASEMVKKLGPDPDPRPGNQGKMIDICSWLEKFQRE